MEFPKLVLSNFCKTPISGRIYSEGVNEYGEPIEYEFSGFCNYQSCCETILTDTQQVIQITGKAYFDGDILPNIPEITSGEVTLYGVKRKIQQGTKARNLDGTVNYTMLRLL